MSFQIGLTTITHIVSYQTCAHGCDLDELENNIVCYSRRNIF